jgi:hypothetical protein
MRRSISRVTRESSTSSRRVSCARRVGELGRRACRCLSEALAAEQGLRREHRDRSAGGQEGRAVDQRRDTRAARQRTDEQLDLAFDAVDGERRPAGRRPSLR